MRRHSRRAEQFGAVCGAADDWGCGDDGVRGEDHQEGHDPSADEFKVEGVGYYSDGARRDRVLHDK